MVKDSKGITFEGSTMFLQRSSRVKMLKRHFSDRTGRKEVGFIELTADVEQVESNEVSTQLSKWNLQGSTINCQTFAEKASLFIARQCSVQISFYVR